MATVLITPEVMREQEAPYVERLKAEGFEIRYPANPTFARGLSSEDETLAELHGVAAVLAGGEIYTPRVLAEAESLRVIARAGVGYDRVDIPAATANRVVVTVTPTANHEAVAEHTLALLLACAKAIAFNDKVTRSGGWQLWVNRALRQRTFGLVGLGRIGQSTAVRAGAFGMRLLAADPAANVGWANEHGIEIVDMDVLLAQSDYVSLHCPFNEQTRGVFDRALFGKMKRGCVLINTARGQLVNEDDLLDALTSGQLAAAGLDVFAQEPTTAEHPLFALDNVVVSQHLAGTDEVSVEAMGLEAAQCIITLRKGGWPDGAVINEDLRGRWSW